MAEIELFPILVTLIGAFLGGFIVARLLRDAADAPIVHAMFVKHRVLASTGMGLALAVLDFVTNLIDADAPVEGLSTFLIKALVAIVAYHTGVTLGWGRPVPQD